MQPRVTTPSKPRVSRAKGGAGEAEGQAIELILKGGGRLLLLYMCVVRKGVEGVPR